jgi:hypothetical protein
VRALALALALLVLGVPELGGRSTARVAFLRGNDLVVLDLVTRREEVVQRNVPPGPVAWSGDRRFASSGGRVAGGPTFPTREVKWAPAGETAAYLTKAGAVVVWSRLAGRRTILPASWGARSLAWGTNGRLALARAVCHVPCGVPRHQEVWVWRGGRLRRVAGPLRGVVLPIVAGFAPDGRVLWWADPQWSGSIRADGLVLYANRSRLATTLVFPDYVVRCGSHLAVAAGAGRYATRGKRILFDGKHVSRDRRRSWVSPACSDDGRMLVAAAGRNWEEDRFGREGRSIWQLLPTRRKLTTPPAGWTDESPHLLADGSVLFVRTRQTSRRINGAWHGTYRGKLELLRNGRLTRLADVGFAVPESADLGYDPNYYGHYGWPWRIAVTK